jgi:Ca2+-binding EF-hand superfamily protein
MFFGSDRPVLIRVHLMIGDKPYTAAWEAWMDKLFAWFDLDNNGFLDQKEAARLMTSQFLQFQTQGSIGGPNNQTVPFVQLDKNKDGKVDKEEFRAYYRNAGFNPLRFFNQNFQARTAKQTNDSLYRHLGLKPDAELKKDDAARLVGLMARLDENEDEMLIASELNLDGDGSNAYGAVVPPISGRMVPAQVPMEQGLIQIQPNMTPATMARQLMAHYDKNKDGKLTPGEGGLSAEFIAQFDVDKDGKLDMEEVKAFFRRQPDLVFRARVGPLNTGIKGMLNSIGLPIGQRQRAELLNPTGPVARKVRKIDGDNMGFDLGDARFAFQAQQGNTFNNRNNGVKNFYLQEFDNVVDKKKGYVEKKQEKENQGRPFLFQLFTQADKNNDGKLTRKELSDWLDLVGEGGSSYVTFQVNDMGRSLFDLIDHNSDSRLSIRELRTAWDRIHPLCKEGKGLLQANLPRTLRITMGQGQAFFNGPFVVDFTGQPAPNVLVKRKSVPTWFTKMDINRDGDVSPKEWLGTEEEFKAIDTDGDGLISAEEARQFEAKRKKESAPPPAPPTQPDSTKPADPKKP